MNDYNPLNDSNGVGRGQEDYIVRSYARVLEDAGLSTCPYNITACRLSVKACDHLSKSVGNQFGFHVMYSEVINAPALYVGVHDKEGGFSPILLVMTSEFIGLLRLYCGGPGCNHETCESLPDGLRAQVNRQASEAMYDDAPEVDTTGFAPIVDNIANELPTFDDMARFYELGDEGEMEGG